LAHATRPPSAGQRVRQDLYRLRGEPVADYYSLTVGQVDSVEAPPRLSKGMGRYPIPVVILARLAVSKSYQGRGIGAAMLCDAIVRTLAISEQVGIRALLTHPIDEDAARFYQRFGFIPSPLREQQWLLLKDARRLLEHA
jgi:GNAT superfamily N-acetyltransferase